jgi:hypothetical protein
MVMIQLPCREAGRFRALARRCVVGRPRGPSPPVRIVRSRDGLTLSASFGQIALSLRMPRPDADGNDGEFDKYIPFAVLEAAEGGGAEIATVEFDPSGKIRCRTATRGRVRETAFEETVADDSSTPDLTARPARMKAVDDGFLAALDECGRSTSAESARFALSRLQLRGTTGQVVGTDGRQLLVCSGFELPFDDDVLIPAVPVFGSRELAAESPVRIGRHASRMFVEAGPWTVALAIADEARFPDVAALLKRTTVKSWLRLTEGDADTALRAIERSLDRSDKTLTVTVRMSPNPQMAIGPTTIALPVSEFEGSGASVAILARYLVRGLRMGLRVLGVDAQQAAVLFADERRSYLVTCSQSDPTCPAAIDVADASSAVPFSASPALSSKGKSVMPSPKNGRTESPTTHDTEGSDETLDPLAEAEGLRVALAEAVRRTGRLIASLRQFHKQRRVFRNAWTSLQQLGLGTREQP